MIINVFAFALVTIAMLCGTMPVSLAAGDSNGQSSQDELSVTRNYLQQAKQRIDELERQLAAGNLENAKRRIGELVLQLHAKENEIAALRANAYESSKKLREDLASQTEELNQAKRRVADVEQLMTTGKGQELTQAKRRAADAEQQTAKKDQELAQAKRRIADIEQLMVGKEQELAQAKRRVADAEQQIAGKDQELTQSRRRIADIEQQMVGKEQELAQAKRRFADAEQQTARKEQELAQAKRRPAEAEQFATSGKEQELAQAKRRVADAEQQIARKEQELAQVKDDLKQATQKLADLNPQLMARDAELARAKQLLADLERNSPKQAELAPAQEDSAVDKNVFPLQSLDQNLAVTSLLPSTPAVADETEALTSSDLGKMSESLASLLQPELKKGSATLRQRGNKLTLAFATGELFPSGDATITLGGTSLLERVGAVLQGFRYQSIEVAGHTDNTPLRNDPRKGVRDNVELSRTRAEHATQVLLNGGLEADRVKAIGYADTKPIAANDTEKNRSKNRRIEIVITQWSESGGTVGDTKAQLGKKLQGFSTQTVTHH
ncbi:OmpA family protein [Candidatus Nitrospira nitrificans]|uniref:OmpA-like domain-containing protein n=1 Tax=Candidatus Nitrospira nitrificans TaxID=1742973 RepID=A0A0S4LPB4_9BACT|nr:OmpA family protein [Candidatus Nitrospira nitrificans]CUS39340.1 exported hypothetical protein [Candidatus Nitrospira nitrificans]